MIGNDKIWKKSKTLFSENCTFVHVSSFNAYGSSSDLSSFTTLLILTILYAIKRFVFLFSEIMGRSTREAVFLQLTARIAKVMHGKY